MELDLRGKKILVTGGSSGLGLAAATSLVNEGALVAICGRDGDRLERAATELRRDRREVITIQADVSLAEGIDKIRQTLETEWGSLDGMINNAGHHTSGVFEDITDEAWHADFDLKVMAVLRGVREMLPLLRKGMNPSILNVLSVFARYQYRDSMPSSVLRATGLAATNALAKDLADEGIRVNAALIGFIHSDQWVRAAGTDDPQAVAEFEKRQAKELGIPLGRAGDPHEFGDVAVFLMSPRSGYMTASAVTIDGGLSPVI